MLPKLIPIETIGFNLNSLPLCMCFSVRALCGLHIATCFTDTWILGQFGKTGPEYPKSLEGMKSNPKSSVPDFTSN